jgi:hypothetical protein
VGVQRKEATVAVALDAALLEILACPSPDHAPLAIGSATDPTADVLTCTSCGRAFPVRDGIPILLLEEAVLPADGDVTEAGTAAEDVAAETSSDV